MEFIQHTINWCKGEIFEGRMFALFGLIVLIIAAVYWKFGNTLFSKAMVIPFLVVGLLCVAAGVGLVYNNQQRIVQFQEEYKIDQAKFIMAEKERTEGFIKWYPYTMWCMALLILIGLCCYLLWVGPNGRAIGLALILFGLSILFLDHFSEERGKNYHQAIMNNLLSKDVK